MRQIVMQNKKVMRQYLNQREAAEALGISYHTLRSRVQRGKIQSVRRNGRVLIPRDALFEATESSNSSASDIDASTQASLDSRYVSREQYEVVVELLREQVSQLKEVVREKEEKHVAEVNRLLDQVEQLQQAGRELAGIARGAIVATDRMNDRLRPIDTRYRISEVYPRVQRLGDA